MIGTLIVLFYYFGWGFLSAVAFAVVALKINGVLGKRLKELRKNRSQLADTK
jgi:Na+-translocating ferredoxin:NAD+ oxidoreductase RnfD subunit